MEENKVAYMSWRGGDLVSIDSEGMRTVIDAHSRLASRVEELEKRFLTADDGFGNEWPPCEKHDCALQVMRPGDARCPFCENDSYYERRILELEQARGAVIRAAIEIVEAEPLKDLREFGRGELRVLGAKLIKQRIVEKLKLLAGAHAEEKE